MVAETLFQQRLGDRNGFGFVQREKLLRNRGHTGDRRLSARQFHPDHAPVNRFPGPLQFQLQPDKRRGGDALRHIEFVFTGNAGAARLFVLVEPAVFDDIAGLRSDLQPEFSISRRNFGHRQRLIRENRRNLRLHGRRQFRDRRKLHQIGELLPVQQLSPGSEAVEVDPVIAARQSREDQIGTPQLGDIVRFQLEVVVHPPRRIVDHPAEAPHVRGAEEQYQRQARLCFDSGIGEPEAGERGLVADVLGHIAQRPGPGARRGTLGAVQHHVSEPVAAAGERLQVDQQPPESAEFSRIGLNRELLHRFGRGLHLPLVEGPRAVAAGRGAIGVDVSIRFLHQYVHLAPAGAARQNPVADAADRFRQRQVAFEQDALGLAAAGRLKEKERAAGVAGSRLNLRLQQRFAADDLRPARLEREAGNGGGRFGFHTACAEHAGAQDSGGENGSDQ